MAQFIMARHNGAGDLNTTYLLHILHHRGNCISLHYIKLLKKILKKVFYIFTLVKNKRDFIKLWRFYSPKSNFIKCNFTS